MATRATLDELADAAASLADPARVVRLGAAAIARACPRAAATAITFRGSPVDGIAQVAVEKDGREVDAAGFESYWQRSRLAFDRAAARPEQRNRWLDPFRTLPPDVRTGFLSSPLYRSFLAPLGVLEQSRMLVFLGSRPLGMIAVALPNGGPYFSDEETRRLARTAAALSGALRIAALVDGAPAALDAVDVLLQGRTDAALLLSRSGAVLGASPRAADLLSAHPALRDALSAAARRTRASSRHFHLGVGGLEAELSRCRSAGSSVSFLAVLVPAAQTPRALSRRQAELVNLLREGFSNAEIAAQMGIAPATVKTMLERLYRDHDVSGRVELLRRLGS